MTEPEMEFAEGIRIPLETLRNHLRSVGADVKVYRRCRLVHPELITLGDHTQIDELVHIFAGTGVTIGCHCHLAFGSSISGGGSCEIGDFASVAAGVRLITGTELANGGGLTNPTVPAEFRSVSRSFVKVGEHALIYTSAVVLPGVTIGAGTVVAAGAIVHHDLKPWGIYAGNPLVQIGVRDPGSLTEKANRLLASERPDSVSPVV